MIDSHAHVAFEQFDTDRDQVIERAHLAGVRGWIEVGTDLEQSRKAVALAEQYQFVWAAVGVHPSDIDNLQDNAWAEIKQLMQHEKVVAVGEVGLDFYRGGTKEQQLPILKRFLSMAQTHNLPVIFHVRNSETKDAHDELIALLASYSDAERPRGVIHTYSGTQAQAEHYLQLGMYLSFSGVITFKNAQELAAIAEKTPLEKILIETDCPFLAPMPYRGKRNEPAYVKYVAQKIAELKNISEEEVQKKTTVNASTLFGLNLA